MIKKYLFTILTVLAASSLLGAKVDRPNILFIITDDQYREQFGFLGGQALTPHIDRLANEGIYFKNGFVSSSVCTPSRYTCMSGQFASRSQEDTFMQGSTAEGVTRILWYTGFVPGQPTIPRVLQNEGYKTGFIGKWHLNGTLHLTTQLEDGSDPYDPEIQAIMHANQEIVQNEIKKFGFDFAGAVYGGNPNDDNTLKATECNVHNQEWLTKEAIDFIETNKDDAWYLYFAPTLMHSPDPYESLVGDPRKSGMGILDTPITGVQPSRASVLARTRAANIPEENVAATWLDDGVGAIMKKLEELDLSEDTLIVYINDNGMEYNSKGTAYQGGIRTQIMAYWPTKIAPGQRPEALVQNVDFAPTFFELAGVEPPESMHLDGASLVPIFNGEEPDSWREAIYSEVGLTRSVMTADWSYVAFYVPPSLQRTDEVRIAEARENYAKMIEVDPEMAKYPFLEDGRYFQLGMEAGGYQFERKQLRDPDNTPWAPNYFDSDQLYNIDDDPTENNNLATNPEYAEQLRKMQALLVEYLNDLPGTYPGLKD